MDLPVTNVVVEPTSQQLYVLLVDFRNQKFVQKVEIACEVWRLVTDFLQKDAYLSLLDGILVGFDYFADVFRSVRNEKITQQWRWYFLLLFQIVVNCDVDEVSAISSVEVLKQFVIDTWKFISVQSLQIGFYTFFENILEVFAQLNKLFVFWVSWEKFVNNESTVDEWLAQVGTTSSVFYLLYESLKLAFFEDSIINKFVNIRVISFICIFELTLWYLASQLGKLLLCENFVSDELDYSSVIV